LVVAMQRAGRKPLPFLMALATSSNIGWAATLIGNPQNMLIGQSAHLSFGHFSLVVMPLVLVCLVLNVLVVAFVYRRELFAVPAVAAAGERLEMAGPHSEVRPWHIRSE